MFKHSATLPPTAVKTARSNVIAFYRDGFARREDFYNCETAVSPTLRKVLAQ